MRVLFVASEGLPYSKTGGLADVIEALPKALVALGHDVAVLLPRYRGTEPTANVVKTLELPLDGGMRGMRTCRIADGVQANGVRYFFVDDPEYFDRADLYGTRSGDYPDNAERFAELCYAALELAKGVWTPEVIHCHDWQSALVPVLLRTRYHDDAQLRETPVVFTIHNMGYQGVFPREVLGRVGVPDSEFRVDGVEFYGQVNYLKAGLVYADYLTTVSRKYAEEIQTPEYGRGLEGVVQMRADRLLGILNGVDYTVWSPDVDPLIAAQYSARDLKGKQECKKDLLKQFHLPVNLKRPVAGIISRFADQKGFDLLAEVAEKLLAEDLAIVVLGTGDVRYERMFAALAERHPENFAVKIAYDNTLAHKIEAGADMFLMPSRYEPCGLNQIYSLRYGTVPVVRATGGLADTIEPFNIANWMGTGFSFQEYTGEALLGAVKEALAVFGDKMAWRCLQANGMTKDFSWEASAIEYARLYKVARKARIRSGIPSSN
jgi:starch synthase